MNLTFAPTNFDDIDKFSQWEIEQGWDIETMQLSAGKSEITYDHFRCPEFVVANFRTRRSMHDVFVLPDGNVLFLICRNKLPFVWCGNRIAPTLLGIARSGIEHTVVLPGDWDCYEFMISEALIRRMEIFPSHFLDKSNRIENSHLPLVEPVTGQFLDCLDRFFQRARSLQGPFDTGVYKVECYELILAGLQSVIDAGLAASDSQSPRATRGTDVVCKAKEFIAANLADELTADVIATSLGISYRALNYAFLDALGVTPYQYLLTARLHGVRRMLKSSDPTITEACFANGFSTPSRFSRQYKRLFGELPSETKKRSRFCPVKCD